MARFLADTSAWVVAQRRTAAPDLRADFEELLLSGELATCGVVVWELLHTTNNATELASRRELLDALDRCPLADADFERGLDVAHALATARGGNAHRLIKLQDALVASAAERAGLTVLHYDGDFDHIAAVTGQPTEWIRPRGSL